MAAFLNRIQARRPKKHRGCAILNKTQFFLDKGFICLFAGYKIFRAVIFYQFLICGGVKGRVGRIEDSRGGVEIDSKTSLLTWALAGEHTSCKTANAIRPFSTILKCRFAG